MASGRIRGERYTTLDGVRGVAAIMVVLFHFVASGPLAMPGGYLAVDLFFALSGFVLASAYGQRLRAGFPPARFMALRLIRLYPVYFLVALLFWSGAGQLLMLPNFAPGALYTPNVPMWSLLLELIASLAYALVLCRLRGRTLAAILVVSGAALAWGIVAAEGSANFGGDWSALPWLAVRTVFSFTAGVALHRWRSACTARHRASPLGWLIVLALVPAMMIGPAGHGLWDLFCITLLFPALVWFGAAWDLTGSRLAAGLGDLSYPLYCLHFPVMLAMAPFGIGAAWVLAALLPTAWAIDRWYDRPVRRWLGGLLKQASADPLPA